MHRLILHVLQLLGHRQSVRYMFLLYRRLTLHKPFRGLNHTSPGAFQTFCTQTYLPHTPSSAIFWIGSIQAFLLLIGGTVTGSLYDRGYPHALVFTGAFLVVLGMMMTSIATSYWRILLAQGVFVGLGNGCLFVPSVSVLPAYFPKNRALALGVAASGSGFGKKPSRQWLFTPPMVFILCYSWCHYTHHVSPTAAVHRLRMGNTSNGISNASHAYSSPGWHENAY